MAAIEQASSSMKNGDIRFSIGHEDGQDYAGDPAALEEEVIL